MNIIINKDHLVYKHELGDYHISAELLLEKGLELEDYILSELKLKNKDNYSNKSIDFKQARSLGFCEYGIEDFCKKLELDIDKSYPITELRDKLSLEVFSLYKTECLTLFGKDIYQKFGGISRILETNSKYLNLVINSGLIEDKILHEFGIKCAESILHIFEDEYPKDKRPRQAINIKKDWLLGKISDKKLAKFGSAARSAAYSAVNSSARSAAHSASNSTYWAAKSAANSSANSAAISAYSTVDLEYFSAYSDYSAAEEDQAKLLLKMIGD